MAFQAGIQLPKLHIGRRAADEFSPAFQGRVRLNLRIERSIPGYFDFR
jgi:hypothetical protein